MIDKFKKLIKKIILREVLEDYRICKTVPQIKKNYRNYCILEKKLLRGGAKKLEIKYKNEKYIFDELDDPETTVKTYVLQAKNYDTDCVMLNINKEDGVVSIHNLSSYGLKCSESLITNIGTHLIKLTIKLLIKYKEKFNIKKIILSDHSFIYCNSTKSNVRMGDLHTLKHGTTFYGTFGFRPFDENKDKDTKLKKIFNNNSIIMKDLKVKDSNLLDYLLKYKNKYIERYKKDKSFLSATYQNNKYPDNENIDNIIDYVKNNENMLLMNIINKISTKDVFDKNCKLLNYLIPKLFKSNNLYSFHNITFELYL